MPLKIIGARSRRARRAKQELRNVMDILSSFKSAGLRRLLRRNEVGLDYSIEPRSISSRLFDRAASL